MKRCLLVLSSVVALGLAACTDPGRPDDAIDADAPATTSMTARRPLPAARLLFLHRSVGGALVRHGQPRMHEVLAALNESKGTSNTLWHHYCGSDPYWNRYYDGDDQQVTPNFGPALHEPEYVRPAHWRKIFCDPDSQYVAARDSIDEFLVIAFKSGYDNTVPYASDRAGEWRQHYLAMKDSEFFRDPRRRIVALGMSPLREGIPTGTQADADSARAFNTWLEEHWPRGRDNLHVFPLFDRLAGPDNWLKDAYEIAASEMDSHPNALGCTEVGAELMTFLHAVAQLGRNPPRTNERLDSPVPR